MAKRRGNSTDRPARAGSSVAPAGQRFRRWAIPGLLAAAALIAVGVLAFGGGATASDPPGGSASVRPVLGRAEAPVLILEYGDFQCPSCGAFARLIEPQIRAA